MSCNATPEDNQRAEAKGVTNFAFYVSEEGRTEAGPVWDCVACHMAWASYNGCVVERA